MPPGPFLLGDWRVEPSLNQLTLGSDSRHLTPKAMEVLVLLASRDGEVVTREELLDGVWSDVTVNEEVLTRAVADLRKALDDDPRAPRYIATIPKRGYRVVAPVSFLERKASPPPVSRSRVWVGLVALVSISGLLTWAFRDVGPTTPRPLDSRPLTSLPGREILPALSPDGSRVAFVWQGETGDNWDVYVKSLDAESVLRLTTDAAIDAAPSWSPDGSRVMFERFREGEPCRILEVEARAGSNEGEREVGSCGASQNPDLASSPDGRYLAFSDRDDPGESFGIFLIDRKTGERRKLVAPDGQHWGDKDPAFSPDGRWISFTRSMSMNTQDVFRVRVEGGSPEQLTFDAREIRRSAFAPDGRSLVVSSARNGHLALWRVPIDASTGSPPQWLLFSGGLPRSPSVAPSGELVFEERTSDTDIRSISIGEPTADASTLVSSSSTREESEPALSPDGERLAFVSTRSGFPEIWIASLLGAEGDLARLTDFRGPHVSSPRWSPDASRVVFDARPDGHADVFWAEAKGSIPHRVTEDPSNDLAPSYSPDGAVLYFGSDRSGTWEIWSLPADGSSPAECVTDDGGYVARASADGESLFFTKFDRPGLYRLDLASRKESVVPGTERLTDPSLWDLGAEEIVLAAVDGMRWQLFRTELASGATRELVTLEDLQPGGGLSVDWGRGRALFTRVVRTESDLVLSLLP